MWVDNNNGLLNVKIAKNFVIHVCKLARRLFTVSGLRFRITNVIPMVSNICEEEVRLHPLNRGY